MSKGKYVNRELSWLDFNKRVLSLAENTSLPIGERVKFLAICANNFVEFFRVRIGGLKLLIDEGVHTTDCSGLTPQDQFDTVYIESCLLFQRMDALYSLFKKSELLANGIEITSWSNLLEEEKMQWIHFTETDILPLLSPVAIKDGEKVPLIKGGVLSLAVHLKVEERDELAIISIPATLDRFIRLQSIEGRQRFLPVEELVGSQINKLFSGYTVLDAVPFVLYRNAGMTVDESISSAFLPQMEKILLERERSFPVRVDVLDTISENLLQLIKTRLSLHGESFFARQGLVELSGLFGLVGAFKSKVLFASQEPLFPPEFEETESIFDLIRESDRLLFHPYDSYFPVVRFLKEAASDPDVLAIKQTLYRTSAESEVVKALKDAAANGKSVTVLCELKARFDEGQNILWARELEDAGVQVVYGVKNLKTHAKAALVIRKGVKGIERFMHFGTGNYNEKTAELYTDFSLFTASKALGADLSQVFNMITGYALPEKMRKIEVSPLTLKQRLMRLIQKEESIALAGGLAHIRAKMNSLVDSEIIEALYRASKAGVRIELNIRGICMLKAGVKKLSESIRVVSVLGRNLEHARLFSFYNDGNEKIFISSADWMPRNLERRIELMIPILDKDVKQKLHTYFDTLFSQSVWRWEYDGTIGEWIEMPGDDIQELLYQESVDEYHETRSLKPLLFETHENQRG